MLFKNLQNLILFFGLGILFFMSCVNQTEDELLKDSLIGCDSATVSYTKDILPLLQNNCYECHKASVATDGIILEGYDNVKSVATTLVNDTSLLVGVTSHLKDFPKMPYQRAKLPACDLAKIRQWVRNGTPNN